MAGGFFKNKSQGGPGSPGSPGASFDIDALTELDERPAEDDFVGIQDTSEDGQRKVTAQHMREGVFSVESIEQDAVPDLNAGNVGWLWKIGPNIMESYADSLDGTELSVTYEHYSHTNYRGAHYGSAAVANPTNTQYFLNLLDGHLWVYVGGSGTEPDGWYQMSASQANTLGYLGYVSSRAQADQLVAHSSGTKVGKLVAWGVLMRRVTSFNEEQTTHTVYRLREYTPHTTADPDDDPDIVGEDILAYSGDLPTTSFPNGDRETGDNLAWTLGTDAPSDWEVTAGDSSTPSTVGIPPLPPDHVDGLWVETVVDGTLVDRKKMVWGPSGSGYLSTGVSQGRASARLTTSATQYLHVVWVGDEYVADDADENRSRLILGYGSSTQPSDTVINVRFSYVRGARGREGGRGLQGVQGVQGRFPIHIYRNSTSALTTAPTGGTYDLDDGSQTAPSDWANTPTTPGSGETTYESVAYINPSLSTGEVTPTWSVPYEFGTDLSSAAIDDRIASFARANNPTGTIGDAQIPTSIMRDSEFTDESVRNLLNLSATEVDDLITGVSESNGVLTFTRNDGSDTDIDLPESGLPADTSTVRSGNTIQVGISGTSSAAGLVMLIQTPTNADDMGDSPQLQLNSESARNLYGPGRETIRAGMIPNNAFFLVAWSASNFWQLLSWPTLTRDMLNAGSPRNDVHGTITPSDLRDAINEQLTSYTVTDSQIPASIMRDSEFTAEAVRTLLGLDADEVNNLFTGATLSNGVITFTQNDGTDVTITLPEGTGGSDGVVDGGSISADGQTLTLTLSEGDDIEIDIPSVLRTGTGLDSALSNLDDDLTTEEQRGILVKLGELNNAFGGLPVASDDWLGRKWINWQTGVEYLCINDPDKSARSVGTFTEVTRSDLQISGGFPTPVLDDYLINTVDWSFWTGVNIRSNTVGWVQDSPTDALFDSAETDRTTIHWMGAYPSDDAALDDLHEIEDATTYFYGNSHDGKVYRLTSSTFTIAQDLRDHYKWITVGGSLRFVDARTGLPTLDQDGVDDTLVALGPDSDFFSVELDVHQATSNTFTAEDYSHTRFLGEQNSAWFIDNQPTETQFTNRNFAFNIDTEQWVYIVSYAQPYQGTWVGGQLPDTHHAYVGGYDDADDAASHLRSTSDVYYDRSLGQVRSLLTFTAGTDRFFTRSWRRVGRSDREVLRVIVDQIGDISDNDKESVRQGLDIQAGFTSEVVGSAAGPFNWTGATSERYMATGITIPDDLANEDWVILRFNHGQYHWVRGDEFVVTADTADTTISTGTRIASYIETFHNLVAVTTWGRTSSDELLVAVRNPTTSTLTITDIEVRRIRQADLIQAFVDDLPSIDDDDLASIQDGLGIGSLLTSLDTTIAADTTFTTNSLRGMGYTLPDADDSDWLIVQMGAGEYRFIRREDFTNTTAASEGDVAVSGGSTVAHEFTGRIGGNEHDVYLGRASDNELLLQVFSTETTISLPAIKVYTFLEGEAYGDGGGGQQSPGLTTNGDDFATVTSWVSVPEGETPGDPTRRYRWEDGFLAETQSWELNRSDAETGVASNALWIARASTRREVDIEGNVTYTDYDVEKYATWEDQYSSDGGTTSSYTYSSGDTHMRTRKPDGTYTPWWRISGTDQGNQWEHLSSSTPYGTNQAHYNIDFDHDVSDYIAFQFRLQPFSHWVSDGVVGDLGMLATGEIWRDDNSLWRVSNNDTDSPPGNRQYFCHYDVVGGRPKVTIGQDPTGAISFDGGTAAEQSFTDSNGDSRIVITRGWFTFHFVSTDGLRENVYKIRAYAFHQAWRRQTLEIYGLRV